MPLTSPINKVGKHGLRPASVSESEASAALRPSVSDNPRLSRFPRTFYSLDELEPAVKQAITARLEPGESLHHVIVAPRQKLLRAPLAQRSRSVLLPWGWTPDWVLAMTERRMLVATLDPPPAMPSVTSTCIEDILSFEWGEILLHAWIEWTQANQGQVERMRVYFNSVGQSPFKRILDSQRHALAAQQGLVTGLPDRRFALLAELPLKFLNFITIELLLPDEQVQAVIFQPALWAGHSGLFRRQEAAAQALVLSNYHMLVAQEALTGRPDSWGLVTRFFPRGRIRRATLEREQDTLWLKLVLETQSAEQHARVRFEPEAQMSLQELLKLL